MLRLLPSLRPAQRRLFSTSHSCSTSWSPSPAPPRLPKEEQEIFEQLQQQSTGAFSTPRAPPQINQSPYSQQDSPPSPETQPLADSPPGQRRPPQINQSPLSAQDETLQSSQPQQQPQQLQATVRTGDGEELHPNVRRGAAPEFEGEVNPKTGEAGGPKNEPLRWGSGSDWSYNGRVTDF